MKGVKLSANVARSPADWSDHVKTMQLLWALNLTFTTLSRRLSSALCRTSLMCLTISASVGQSWGPRPSSISMIKWDGWYAARGFVTAGRGRGSRRGQGVIGLEVAVLVFGVSLWASFLLVVVVWVGIMSISSISSAQLRPVACA